MRRILLITTALWIAWDCQAAPPTSVEAPTNHSTQALKQVSSSDGTLTVAYSWNSPAIKVGDFQVLHVSITKAPAACQRSAIGLTADASMPEHGHGLNYHVVVKAGAHSNEFEISGIMFHMQGAWELHIDVQCGAAHTRAYIPVAVR